VQLPAAGGPGPAEQAEQAETEVNRLAWVNPGEGADNCVHRAGPSTPYAALVRATRVSRANPASFAPLAHAGRVDLLSGRSCWPVCEIDLWRNPGDDLEIAASEHHARPTQTKALTCISGKVHRSSAFQSQIRDEEAAGSNPATPTQVKGHSPRRDVAIFYAVQQQGTATPTSQAASRAA
jgi:hypothetical protein